ncbi:glycosyltransferase [Candidatus Woesearchaeota archaeon]|nr:glycosyltransferase [Candidatus Woesearchaeota archaeon]
MSVSIIIPAHNSERTIMKCIDSISNGNIIIIDDASNKPNFLKQKSNILKKIKIIRLKEQKGSSYARNLGVKHSQSEIIIFIDSDSYLQISIQQILSEWKIFKMKYPKLGAMAGKITFKDNFMTKVLAYSETSTRMFHKKPELRKYLGITGFLITTRKAFNDVGGFDESLMRGQDRDFTYKLYLKGYQLIYNPKLTSLHDVGKINLKSLLKRNYVIGKTLGLNLELKYSKIRRLTWQKYVNNLFTYPLLIIPIALWQSISIFLDYFLKDPKLIFYSPFIFLSKLSYRFGCFIWILNDRN